VTDLANGRRELDAVRARWREEGATVGFVPTMGALHEGHQSLVRASRDECDRTIVSVFVNPLQFGPGEDFERYPRDLDRDRTLLREAGADCLFTIDRGEMFADGFRTTVTVEGLSTRLCGAFRPGHFAGVATILAKLFHLVRPDVAYFGEKDAQQCVVVRRLVEDLDFPLRIRTMPIVREADGLAMSSRNRYLSTEERERAKALHRALRDAEALVAAGESSADRIVQAVTHRILEDGRPEGIDYVALVDPATLDDVRTLSGEALLAVAVRFGGARLIDNVRLRPGGTR